MPDVISPHDIAMTQIGQWNSNCFAARHLDQEPQIILRIDFKLELARLVWADLEEGLPLCGPEGDGNTARGSLRPLVQHLSNYMNLARPWLGVQAEGHG